MNNTILVTGIGGNVGQGILRNIINLGYPVSLVGTNTERLSAGNHLCNSVHVVPYAFDPGYITKMADICEKEKVDLIIPGTDYESYYLAVNQESLPPVAASPADTAYIFLDKYNTYEHFVRHDIPFAASSLPGQYQEQPKDKDIILKPRKGRGSRGITINPTNIEGYDDNEYMVQKLYKGKEITTAFYITRTNELLGHITLERTLSAGTTNTCIVTTEYDKELEVIIRKIMRSLTVRGSCNIQSIVTGDGQIIPFEINGRISGTNSIRSNFGFEDVKYTVDEYLYDKAPETPVIKMGAAVRIIMDVIYPGVTSFEEIKNKNTQHYLY